jgi:hypothetical protein
VSSIPLESRQERCCEVFQIQHRGVARHALAWRLSLCWNRHAVAPGPVEPAMLDRVTAHNAKSKAGFLSMVPGSSRRSQGDRRCHFLFITSASFLTGQSIFLDGGITAG